MVKVAIREPHPLVRTNLIFVSKNITPIRAGFTDHVFALCHLLGFRFAPRIRDLADKRLYVPGSDREYAALAPLASMPH